MKEPEQDKPEDLSVKETAEADDATNSTAAAPSAMTSTAASATSSARSGH